MDSNSLKGDWNIIKGKVKEQWGKLTDDDLTEINGKKDQLLGQLQKKYGYAKEKAAEEFSKWEKKPKIKMKLKNANMPANINFNFRSQ